MRSNRSQTLTQTKRPAMRNACPSAILLIRGLQTAQSPCCQIRPDWLAMVGLHRLNGQQNLTPHSSFHLDLGERDGRETRNWLLTSCIEFEGRKERESENATPKQTDTPNQMFGNSKCHTQGTSTHMTRRPSQQLPNKTANPRIPHASNAWQWTRRLICWTPNNRTQPFAATVWVLLSCRLIDGCSETVGSRSHNWVPGKMAKHKPYKFACSTLRLEGPAVRKCNTNKPKALEDRRTDEAKTLEARTNTANSSSR